MRETEKQAKAKAKRRSRGSKQAAPSSEVAEVVVVEPPAPGLEPAPEPGEEEKRQRALDLVLETVEDLFEERGEEDKVWGSMVKQAIKRRNPGFNETYHGFRTFGRLLEEAQTRKLLELTLDEKSGGYIIKSFTHE